MYSFADSVRFFLRGPGRVRGVYGSMLMLTRRKARRPNLPNSDKLSLVTNHEGLKCLCLSEGSASHGQFIQHLLSNAVLFFAQSWSVRNLFNLWQRSLGRHVVKFHDSNKTLFQQRWKAKALMRAYHGDFINEKIFKRYYLPATLPDVRPRNRTPLADTLALDDYAGRNEQLERTIRRKEEEDKKGLAPVGSLMMAEVERRMDVFIFRCCFAHSVYEARRMVIHGHVLLNGRKVRFLFNAMYHSLHSLQHNHANTRLAPGDMVSVDPAVIPFLQKPKVAKKSHADAAKETDGETAGAPEESPSISQSLAEERPTEKLTPFYLPPYASPFIFLPAYAEVSFPTCSAVYVRHPTARPGYSEIPTPYDADGEIVRLAWEWYSKRRPRNRSKSHLARIPGNRR